jgi:hypothetical protein
MGQKRTVEEFVREDTPRLSNDEKKLIRGLHT